MNPEKLKVMLIMLVSVTAVSLGEAMLAKGMKQTVDGTFAVAARSILTNVYVVGGMLLMMVYFGMYMYALKLADLSFVLPLTALSYILGALLAKYFLHEDVNPAKWIGTLVITLGVVIIGLGSDSSH